MSHDMITWDYFPYVFKLIFTHTLYTTHTLRRERKRRKERRKEKRKEEEKRGKIIAKKESLKSLGNSNLN